MGTGNEIVWIILGVFIVIIIVFITYSALKDKAAKKRRKRAELEARNQANLYRENLIFELDELWKQNELLLEKFEPSIGEYKMGDVVSWAYTYIDSISNSSKFKEYVLDGPYNAALLDNIGKLRTNRSSSWSKKCFDVREWINKEMENIDKDFQQNNITQSIDKVKEFYNEKLQENTRK
ncbi:MHJ_0274 family protein [Mycoplasmopsis opalescens]|uniref:MHJ_0274 family protein n=1 Tax=Mycoplasmopsis opalescens TaxID=114886 RepID=UPI0004A6C10B|nr:hypothetical protein [Mycoplasmopsis opalescens]